MKQFNLKTWQENPNLKVVTRSGREVHLLHKIYKLPKGFVTIEGIGYPMFWDKDGVSNLNILSFNEDWTLFFADPEPEEEMYVNVYKMENTLETSSVYYNKTEAIKSSCDGCIGTYKLTKVTE